MSYIAATVENIKSLDSLHVVEFRHKENQLFMMSLQLHDEVQKATKVKLLIKPMHIAIGKSMQGLLSYSNQLKTTITSIQEGELLCSVKLDYFGTTLESIITQKSSQQMNLKVGEEVLALIKASDLSISEFLDA